MKKTILLLAVSVLTGCATVADAPKTIMGVSTRGVETARATAVTGDYQADFMGIFDAVLGAAKEKGFYVFSQDEVRGMIVLMNVPGFVDTTEVGVFISSVRAGVYRVEVSSRSSPAKEAVADIILGALGKKYKKL